jgi:hypothetical protein
MWYMKVSLGFIGLRNDKVHRRDYKSPPLGCHEKKNTKPKQASRYPAEILT